MTSTCARQRRKLEHVRTAIKLADGPGKPGFEDVHLLHNALPELDYAEVSTETVFLGRRCSLPIIVNAMTGGAHELRAINRGLARLAARKGLPMAVGSQHAALEDPGVSHSFNVVRGENPDGTIIANLSARAKADEALRAVEMLRADALQLHLNPAHELVIPEGERCFRGILDNIRRLVEAVPVPIIVKEVGFGIAGAQAAMLAETGIEYLDIGGCGGTNFVAIEAERRGVPPSAALVGWGIPTAASLIEVACRLGGRLKLIASGGIRTGLDIAKALCVGAAMVGIAGPLLKLLALEDEDLLSEEIDRLAGELVTVMLLTGSRTPPELSGKPLALTGFTAEWLRSRGIEPAIFSARG